MDKMFAHLNGSQILISLTSIVNLALSLNSDQLAIHKSFKLVTPGSV